MTDTEIVVAFIRAGIAVGVMLILYVLWLINKTGGGKQV